MDKHDRPSEKVGKFIGHAVEVAVPAICDTVRKICKNIKDALVRSAAGIRSRSAYDGTNSSADSTDGAGRVVVRQVRTDAVADFFDFKLLLFPVIIRVIYLLAVASWVVLLFIGFVKILCGKLDLPFLLVIM